MVQGMSRRHLFDNGYPVCHATLIAGSYVLLAVSNQSVRKSRVRLASSLLQIANTSQRVMQSLTRHVFSRATASRGAPRPSEVR